MVITHHTNKMSRGGIKTNSGAVRGTTALTDGPRWQCNLECRDVIQNAAELSVLRFTKVNTGKKPNAFHLCRVDEYEGAMRRASTREVGDYLDARDRAKGDEL